MRFSGTMRAEKVVWRASGERYEAYVARPMERIVAFCASKRHEMGFASHFCGEQSSGAAMRAADAASARAAKVVFAFMGRLLSHIGTLRARRKTHWTARRAHPGGAPPRFRPHQNLRSPYAGAAMIML